MPTLKDDKPTLDDLLTEQHERSDDAYLTAVRAGLIAAVKQADAGDLIPAERVWDELGVGDAKR